MRNLLGGQGSRLQYTSSPPTVDVQINMVGTWHEHAACAAWFLLRACFNRRISGVVEVADSQTSADLHGKIERWFENHPLVLTAISLNLDEMTRIMLWKLDPISETARVRFCIDFSPEDKDWEIVSQAWSLDFFIDICREETSKWISRLEKTGGTARLVGNELPLPFFEEDGMDLSTMFPLNK
ncbi:hypothetical protein E1B28_012989 [Marasmius oreades]|uniref:Uncharacterized protein n=1 Tax=Marasmius oreades TaxID=181124 RepID=A0A9P7RNR2_9AGAR|nr:uncharacterized protein E1B28_012989 [Marasmius oreades]KAG7087011.1 hypothetical protein E1B28_012989 [Marasmius oreades]